MKPTVTANDIPLLQAHPTLPSVEDMLARFESYYRESVGGAVPPSLPLPDSGDADVAPEDADEAHEANATSDELVADADQGDRPDEVSAGDSTDAEGSGLSDEDATDEDAAAAPDDAVGSDAATVLEMQALPDEEIASAPDDADGSDAATVLEMQALPDEEVPADQDGADAATVLETPALSDELIEASKEEEAPTKRKGRKSRKAKKKKS